MSKGRFRIASVPFINAAPYTEFINEVGGTVDVLTERPSELAGMLVRGDVDAALVPVVEFLKRDDLILLGSWGIASDGPVKSVLLKCRCPINEVVRVAPDAASATSNALASVLLREKFKVNARMVEGLSAEESDAFVAIGDPALVCDAEHCEEYDLSAEWKEMTGLPFVFAVWACRAGFEGSDDLMRILEESYRIACGRVEELSLRCSGRIGLSVEACSDYLKNRVVYSLGEREHEAIMKFADFLKDK